MRLIPPFFLLLFVAFGCRENMRPSEENIYQKIDSLRQVTNFSSEVRESSGLEYFSGQIWTHNDSGDAANLYRIDSTSGEVLQQVHLSEARNIDWEDLCADSSHIYVGDFGNNLGNRENLLILKVDKPDAAQESISEVDTIAFRYLDQNSFIFEKEMHDFNCEAMITTADSLYIFTKNHITKNVRSYALPTIAGTYELTSFDAFPVEGLITAADFDEENKVLILLGYEKNMLGYQPFVWCFWDFSAQDFFKGQSKRFDLNINEQAEGLAHIRNGIIYISTEKEMTIGGNIWEVDLQVYLSDVW